MSDLGGQPPFGTFQEAFCHAYRCSELAYPQRALVRAIPWWRRPFVVPFIWLFPATFGIDVHILQLLGKTRSKHEFSQLLDEFYNAIRVTRSWSKRWLGFKMSGHTLIELRDELDPLILPGERPPDPRRMPRAQAQDSDPGNAEG
jgi:hypothetical protein